MVGPRLAGRGSTHALARAPGCDPVPVSFPGMRVVLNILSIW